MIPPVLQSDPFKEQLRESLQRETLNSRTVKIAKHANVMSNQSGGNLLWD